MGEEPREECRVFAGISPLRAASAVNGFVTSFRAEQAQLGMDYTRISFASDMDELVQYLQGNQPENREGEYAGDDTLFDMVLYDTLYPTDPKKIKPGFFKKFAPDLSEAGVPVIVLSPKKMSRQIGETCEEYDFRLRPYENGR